MSDAFHYFRAHAVRALCKARAMPLGSMKHHQAGITVEAKTWVVGAGLPEAEGSGLSAPGLDDAASGRAHPRAWAEAGGMRA
jgi:hypothetical protein